MRSERALRRLAATLGALWLLSALAAAPRAHAASPVVASAWCTPSGEAAPGCDVGAAVSLYRWQRAHLVAVLGLHSLGGGVAWIVETPSDYTGPTIAVALGAVVGYSEDGLGREVYPALGATLSFGRGVRR